MPAEKQKQGGGPYLKSGLNMADTGSVVNEVRGHIKTGTCNTSNSKAENNMVSANATLTSRKYPRASR